MNDNVDDIYETKMALGFYFSYLGKIYYIFFKSKLSDKKKLKNLEDLKIEISKDVFLNRPDFLSVRDNILEVLNDKIKEVNFSLEVKNFKLWTRPFKYCR